MHLFFGRGECLKYKLILVLEPSKMNLLSGSLIEQITLPPLCPEPVLNTDDISPALGPFCSIFSNTDSFLTPNKIMGVCSYLKF